MIGYGTLPAQYLRGSMHRSDLSGKRSTNERSCTPIRDPRRDGISPIKDLFQHTEEEEPMYNNVTEHDCQRFSLHASPIS
jgi:hypothetical protein